MIFGALANTDQLKNVIKIIFNVPFNPTSDDGIKLCNKWMMVEDDEMREWWNEMMME